MIGPRLLFYPKRIAARLGDSLWFLPAIIVLGFALLALGMVDVSAMVPDAVLRRFPRIFGADADSSRGMLSTIAGSIVTIAGVTFSITVLVISWASSQYTPRILRNFLRDRPSQVALGVLTGVCVYCLMVMRSIRAEASGVGFVPSLAVLVGMLSGVIAIGFFVYFLNHVASNLEAGTIIARVARETSVAVARLFPSQLGHEPDCEARTSPPFNRKGDCVKWYPIEAQASGYLQRVEADGLLRIARDDNLLLRLEVTVGEFVGEGSVLVSVADKETDDVLSDTIRSLFAIAAYRTVNQDAAFGLRQLVDIAIKALSPGVNDPTTAVTCIDYLGVLLAQLANRRIEDPHRVVDGVVRLIATSPTFESLVDTAVDEIRLAGAGNPRVLAQLLAALERAVNATRSAERLRVLERHASAILSTGRAGIRQFSDQVTVFHAYSSFTGAVDSNPAMFDRPRRRKG